MPVSSTLNATSFKFASPLIQRLARRADLEDEPDDGEEADSNKMAEPVTPNAGYSKYMALSTLDEMIIPGSGSTVEYSPAECSRHLNEIMSDFNYYLSPT